MQHSKGFTADHLPSSSRSPPKRKLSFPRVNEETRPIPHGLHSGSSDLDSPSKQRKITRSLSISNSQSSMNKGMGEMARPDVVYLSKNIQPQTGIRKLVIKNLRREPRENLKDHYDRIWKQVSSALVAVFAGREPKQPLERLYRDVEDICRNGQAEALFQHLNASCNQYLETSLLPHISSLVCTGSSAIETLRVVHKGWEMWSSRSVQIRSIFSYLDRSFLHNSKTYPQLNDMTITQFRRVVCETGQFGTHIYLGMCDLVNKDRSGMDKCFDSALLRDSVMMLHVMDLYQTGFEPVFLQSSRSFIEELDSKSWVSFNLKTYILSCVRLLDRESARCDAYNLDSGTKRALLITAQSILLKQRSARLLDSVGIAKLLEADEVDTLKALYSLLKSSEMDGRLKGPWEDYIKKVGSTIVRDLQKSGDMVVRLLELKRSLEVVIRDAFDKDETFKYAMREAYSGFINERKTFTAWGTGNAKVGEVIAKYIDLLLRGGLKAVPRSLASDSIDRDEAEKRGEANTGDEDAELDRQLEQGIELFRFIEGKDVFEAFYKKDLARRLLMGRSASQDAERNMLTKLKSECGSNFTHNLEQMFKDQEISRDEMISFKQSLSNTSKATLDLQVSVLSAAAWPTYPDVKVNLPSEVARHIEKYDRHYKHKHTGRRLTWKHALAHSIVKAQFNRGAKELVVSGFQAIVLVLFNNIGVDGNLSYEDIQRATGLVDAELQRTLQSLACAKIRILNKHPKGREVNNTDTFTINVAFTDPKYRIKINQIQLKETTEENKETHERVALDRQYETQAAIVRIMKSRKIITHANLVAEVIDQTKSRGAVEVSEIKKNIEKLIEKDYMERDGSSYTYLA